MIFEDAFAKTYIKLIFTKDGDYLLGGILVGDTSNYTKFCSLASGRNPSTLSPSKLIIGSSANNEDDVDLLPDDTQVCSCHNVSKGTLVEAIRPCCESVAELKKRTKAATACGGCEPTLKLIFQNEMKKMGNKSRIMSVCISTIREPIYFL